MNFIKTFEKFGKDMDIEDVGKYVKDEEERFKQSPNYAKYYYVLPAKELTRLLNQEKFPDDFKYTEDGDTTKDYIEWKTYRKENGKKLWGGNDKKKLLNFRSKKLENLRYLFKNDNNNEYHSFIFNESYLRNPYQGGIFQEMNGKYILGIGNLSEFKDIALLYDYENKTMVVKSTHDEFIIYFDKLSDYNNFFSTLHEILQWTYSIKKDIIMGKLKTIFNSENNLLK